MSNLVYRDEAGAHLVEAQYRKVLEQWPLPRRELFVPTCMGQTFVLVCGSETKPPLVLLHGSQANLAAWIADVELWAIQFRIYAIDMIGEPDLSAPVRPALNGPQYATWLDDVFNALGIS